MNQLEKSTSDLKLYLKRSGFEVWTLGEEAKPMSGS